MPHLTYRRTEEPGYYRCEVTATRAVVGWVRKVPRGWGYRTKETDRFTYGLHARHEAGDALLSISAGRVV